MEDQAPKEMPEEYTKIHWRDCEKQYIRTQSTGLMLVCNYHWDQKLTKIKDTRHPQHAEYPMWCCECKIHRRLQKLEEEYIGRDKQHLEHGLRGTCTVPNCNMCSETERAEEGHEIIEKGDWQEQEHALTSWAFCCHNKCPTHRSDKEGAG